MAYSAPTLLLLCVRTGEEFELSAEAPTLIGNCPDCTIAISKRSWINKTLACFKDMLFTRSDSPDKISAPRIHAVIVYREDSFCLIDQSKYDKNRLNNDTLWPGQPYPLKEGDCISLLDDLFAVEEIRKGSEEGPLYPNAQDAALLAVYAPPEFFLGDASDRPKPLPVPLPPDKNDKKDR